MKTVRAIRFSKNGGPEVLEDVSIGLPEPATGEIQIRHEAIGLNFIDIYHRKGVFAAKLPLPSGLGVEGVGEVIAVGPEVVGFTCGDRIAYVGGPPGAYATHRNLPASRAVHIPEDMDAVIVAATIFKGLTAEYLVHRCVAVEPGDFVLVHAAAGGVGSLACQWLRKIGATVIGTVGNSGKVNLAHENGCDEVLVNDGTDFANRVRELTGGRGVRVVYDSVGADTFAGSLDSLQRRGILVSFGESSGPVPALGLGTLAAKGSLFVTRPSIAHYTADPGEYRTAASRLFAALQDGSIRPQSISRYALADAPKAQADMEARRTVGSVVLLP